ncbi:hypothetical protein [Robertmurraya sp. P23]|uniref:hypothetical protein n=1 Tax=Robertmurraya sp. P23 TaxID=3436931 RepID=UPI003D9589C2
MILVFLASVFIVITLAFWIDSKRKKNKNNPHIPTNPNAKPGDSTNYLMGDNKYTGGSQ